jgi:hypothetical protein
MMRKECRSKEEIGNCLSIHLYKMEMMLEEESQKNVEDSECPSNKEHT